MTYESCDYPVGVSEIAVLLDVKPATVSQWGVRKNLPPVDAVVNSGNTRLWRIDTILNWASATGRNNRELADCDSAIILVMKEMIDDTKSAINETTQRWQTMAKQWNNYRTSYGAESYDFGDLGSYTFEEE